MPGDYQAGTYFATASVVDAAGNTASCTFNFTIITDTTPPTVTCPVSQSVNTNVNLATAVVSWPSPNPMDAFGIQSAGYTPSQYTPPAVFSVGSTTVVFTAIDPYNNVQTCTFVITVLDKQPPTIVCPASFTVGIPFGQTEVNVTWGTPVARDNNQVDQITQSCVQGSSFAVGVYACVAYATGLQIDIIP